MASAAAFFDLDRTLLKGASGPAISRALQAAGLLPERTLPGQDLLFGLFNLVGENRPSMVLTRQSARMTAGWDIEALRRAGVQAGATLEDEVQPWVRPLVEEHHAEGRQVVLATTSPYELVKPLADRLGIDHVLATRYEVVDGRCTGQIDGRFVWGKEKLAEAREWAAANDVALGESWAYTDSYYDAPLLAAVGHPVAVNPDPRLAALAVVRRWPTRHLDAPEGVPKLANAVEPQQALFPFVRGAMRKLALPWVRIDVTGVANLPAEGPAIVVANHRSYFDPLAVGTATAEAGRPVRFLGKKEVFDAPVVGDLAKAMGGIRVERGTGSDEPLKEAAAAIAAGELVAIMPQGTIPRGRAFFDPVLKGRWGAARLAAMTRAPVVPIGLWGTEQVWPRSAKVPNLTNVVSPPTVTVAVGPPVQLGLDDPEADTEAIMAAIADLLPPEARAHREPTEAELAAASPGGRIRDEDLDRRPGTD